MSCRRSRVAADNASSTGGPAVIGPSQACPMPSGLQSNSPTASSAHTRARQKPTAKIKAARGPVPLSCRSPRIVVTPAPKRRTAATTKSPGPQATSEVNCIAIAGTRSSKAVASATASSGFRNVAVDIDFTGEIRDGGIPSEQAFPYGNAPRHRFFYGGCLDHAPASDSRASGACCATPASHRLP
jgi:hypothetical protein